jgi:hypothetical protein
MRQRKFAEFLTIEPMRILLKTLRALPPLLFIFAVLASARQPKPFIDWKDLDNPVLAYPEWSIKDAAMDYRDGLFYVFFSAFYQDHGRVRSHVVEVSTPDFKTYSRPIFDFDGEEDGWIGMCSPDVQWTGKEYEVSFNSWGNDPKKPDQLFYMTSPDLVHWSSRYPLAANLTRGERAIDAALAHSADGFHLIWKSEMKPMRPRMAVAPALSGPWHFIGSGYPALKMRNGRENGLIHENFEFIRIDGKWRLLTSDYPHGHHEYLYTLKNDANWLDWDGGFELHVIVEGFNESVHADAAALRDWRKYDGYFYLIYAGRDEDETYLHRGWNRLGLSRSKDLVHWLPAGTMN